MASDLVNALLSPLGYPAQMLGQVAGPNSGPSLPTQSVPGLPGVNLGMDPLTAQIAPDLQNAQTWIQKQIASILNYPTKALGLQSGAPTAPNDLTQGQVPGPNFGLAMQGLPPGVNPPQPAQFNPMMPLAALTAGGGSGI